MTNSQNPIDGLYNLSNEKLEDAGTSRKERNAFLAGFIAAEGGLCIAKIAGVDIEPVVFGITAYGTLMPAAVCESSRLLNLRISKNFRDCARLVAELDMKSNPQ